ncbi:MAG: acyltransferase [Bacteroidales bacterium]
MTDIFIHPTAIIDEGCRIGEGTTIWHFSHLMPCQVGKNCVIGQNVFIGKDVIIGNRVKIQNNVSVYTGVTCEDDVFLGPSMVFTNVINPRSAIERKHEFKPTLVKKGATIGANATILCGIVIGEYAFIGAGAVVTHDVKPYALVVGNPARQTGWVSECGVKLNFNNEGIAVCPQCKEKYQLDFKTQVVIKVSNHE